MEETKHTPGPWFTEYDGHGGIYVGGADELQVGFVSSSKYQEANARLIAAAPELLAVLEIARNYVEATTLNASSPKTRQNYGDCLRRIDAAIAKATGAREVNHG